MSRWRSILLNRFVLVPGAIVLAIVLWNVYVATHNHGLITGRVIDPAGRPVADATVALWVFNFTTYEEKERVKTDADGTFRFTNNPSHRIQISAEKPGVGRSPRIPVFLYFRAQDTTLGSPLRLADAS
jgi:protocatechuate 3,4-dioxygenase beta subunit